MIFHEIIIDDLCHFHIYAYQKYGQNHIKEIVNALQHEEKNIVFLIHKTTIQEFFVL